MQDLKKSKRKMNANQMTNPFLSNEEAIDKDTCDDWFNNLNRYIYNYEKRKYDYDKLINYIEDVYNIYNGTYKD